MANRIEGLDISNHNGVVQWPQIKAAGIAFSFIKATEGNNFVDPYFARNMAGARAAGIIVGAYHYYRYDVDPAAQAEHFLRTIGRVPVGDLPPTIDVEAPADGSGASQGRVKDIAGVAIMLRLVEAGTGRKPIVYTYPSVWGTTMGGSKDFGQYPLWIANYGVQAPTVPQGWQTYTFWQYTDRGSVGGAPFVDRDVFNGDMAALLRLTGQATPPAPPTPNPTPRPEAIKMTQETVNGHVVHGNIYQYWAAGGRIPVFGMPVSDEFTQRINGQDYTVQYFERQPLACDKGGNVTRMLAGAELFARIRGELGYKGA